MVIRGNLGVQQNVAHQLQGLQIHDLYLNFQCVYTPECQSLWHAVGAVERMGLCLGSLKGTLNMMPAGPELYIRCWDVGCDPLQISWQALLAGADRTVLDVVTIGALSICSPGSSTEAQHLGRPWQLVIEYTACFGCFGLPPPLASKEGTYFWQNRTGVSAGCLQRDWRAWWMD